TPRRPPPPSWRPRWSGRATASTAASRTSPSGPASGACGLEKRPTWPYLAPAEFWSRRLPAGPPRMARWRPLVGAPSSGGSGTTRCSDVEVAPRGRTQPARAGRVVPATAHQLSGGSPTAQAKQRVNEEIRIRQVRLIDEKGVQHGVVDTDAALAMARERGLD